ncbi:MAG TPA: sulfotransferase domain-containing protein [Gemmatimonadales bacterium]|nr:sulfotransferase domain-containing protein [Gemmatimonadales bacterium]
MKRPLRRLRADYRQLTAPLRGLPSTLIIGAQKAGTTSLFNYLIQHPDVLPSLRKEVHYFDFQYHRGVNWYRGHFPYTHQLRRGFLTLDASPYYLVHPLVPQRVAQLLPEIKLVALLRNPVDRALSHYQHEVRGGRESLSFAEALEKEPERLAGEEERLLADPSYYSYNHHRFSYLRRGRYVDQLRQWTRHFPRSRLLVLQSEELFRDPAGTTAAVHGFLGLKPHRLRLEKPFLQTGYDRSIPLELRSKLVAYFEPYNQQLYQWLGQEFDWA